MPQSKGVNGFEVGQDLQFQQKEWKFERAGWVVMAVLILLALLGLFGGGPVSQGIQSGAEGFQVTYERFDRQMNPSQLLIQLPAGATQEGQARFWIDRQYLENFQIEDVSPDPDSVEVSSDRITYVLNVSDPEQPVFVKMDIQAEGSGLIRGQVGWDEGSPVSFSQIVFP